MYEWDSGKDRLSKEKATEKLGSEFTPEWIQLYLSLYYDKSVKLQHVMGGFNLSNGFNYYVYGFKFDEPE